jgi:hypothetical protein
MAKKRRRMRILLCSFYQIFRREGDNTNSQLKIEEEKNIYYAVYARQESKGIQFEKVSLF